MPEDKKLSWGSGVLDPDLWGRSDLQRWAAGSKKATNWFVTPRGSLANRPGTIHVDETAYHVTNGMGKARLIPFIFSDGDAVLCVFTNFKVRFYRWPTSLAETYGAEYAVDMVPSSWPVLFELVTPYHYSVLDKIRYAQIGNLMVLTHEDYPAQELRRLLSDGSSWSITEMDFDVPDYPRIVEWAPIINTPAYESGMQGGFPRLATGSKPGQYDEGHASGSVYFEDGDDVETYCAGTDELPALAWQWKVTRVMEDSEGRRYETFPYTVGYAVKRFFRIWSAADHYEAGDRVVVRDMLDSADPRFYEAAEASFSPGRPVDGGNTYWTELADFTPGDFTVESSAKIPSLVAVYPEHPVCIEWARFLEYQAVTDDADRDRIVATRVYRGRDGRFGLIGETTGEYITDDGAEPDYANPPPAGENPFKVYDADGVLVRTEYPITCAFHQERLLLGGTTERPNWVWGSAVGEFRNFDRILPADPADSYSFEIAASELEAVRAIVPRRQLLLLCSGSEFVVEGDGPIIHPAAAINPIPITSHGCAALAPVKVGSDLIVLDPLGVKPVAMAFQNEAGGYELNDVAVLAAHLFNRYQIKAMAYAKTPYSILWAVRSDGKLLSLTYVKEHELWAWCEHEIAGGDFYDFDTTLNRSVRKGSGGFVEDVCVLPESDQRESGVYLIVRRGTGRCIERLAKRNITDVRRSVFVDDATVYEVRNAYGDTPVAGDLHCTITDAYGWDGEAVHQIKLAFVRHDGTPVSTYPIEVGAAIQFDHPTDANETPLRVKLTVNNGDDTFRAELLPGSADPTDWLGEIVTGWNHLFQSVPGVGRLSGQDIVAVVDGRVIEDVEVVAGSVVFGNDENAIWGAIAAVGIRYNSDWGALDLAQDDSKKKIAESALIVTSGARGGQVGADFDHLVNMVDRKVEDSYGIIPMREQEKLVTVPDTWKFKAPVVFRQSDPLPMTLLKVIRNYKLGG